jgi:hypothetical protein
MICSYIRMKIMRWLLNLIRNMNVSMFNIENQYIIVKKELYVYYWKRKNQYNKMFWE